MASANLLGFVKNATLSLQILPGVLEGVKGIEDQANAIKASGGPVLTGAQKKDLVMSAVTSSIQVAAQAGEQIPNPWIATVSGLVDLVVSMLNAYNIFHHAASASPTVPARSKINP